MRNILIFLDNFDTGGVTSVVQSIYRNLNGNGFCIDFARRKVNINDFDEEVISSGNSIYYYDDCGLNKIPFWNYKHRQLFIAKQIVSQINNSSRKYDVIHIHANPIIGLYIGIKLRVPIRVMHTHEAIPDFGDNIYKSKVAAMIWKYRQKKYNGWSTIKAGDSKKACCVKYGKNVVNDHRMVVLYPPVDMCRFSPDSYRQDQIHIYNVNTSEFNMIHVGRLNPVKNQSFMIDILCELNKIRPSNLYIVGDGALKEELESYSKTKGVENRVFFLPGNTTPGLYKLMNCSMLPSLSEAFGMVAVESQLMGVPCFASTNVPDDVDIGMCSFIQLEQGAVRWAQIIDNYDYSTCQIDEDKKNRFKTKELLTLIAQIYNGEYSNE